MCLVTVQRQFVSLKQIPGNDLLAPGAWASCPMPGPPAYRANRAIHGTGPALGPPVRRRRVPVRVQ